MILTKVKIQNFRSIKEEILDFSDNHCKILVGINEAGKSNVLKALSSLQTKYNSGDIRRGTGDETILDFNITFYFLLSKQEKNIILEKISPEFSNVNNGFFVQNGETTILNIEQLLDLLTIEITETSQKQHIINTNLNDFDFSCNIKSGIYKTTTNPATTKENSYLQSTKYFLSKEFDEDFYSESELNFEDVKNKILAIIKDFVKDQTKKVVFWEYNEKNILPSEIDYNNFLSDPNSNHTLKALFEIANKNNWAEEIKSKIEADRGHIDSFLKTHYSQKILKYFKEKWPELNIKDLKIKLDGSLLRFAFIDQGDNEFYANE